MDAYAPEAVDELGPAVAAEGILVARHQHELQHAYRRVENLRVASSVCATWRQVYVLVRNEIAVFIEHRLRRVRADGRVKCVYDMIVGQL